MTLTRAIKKLENARTYAYRQLGSITRVSDFFGCNGVERQAWAETCQTLSDSLQAIFDEQDRA